MKKKILIAVDSSIHSHNAMDYALEMGSLMKEAHFVLLNIQPIISQYLLEEALKRPKSKEELNRLYKTHHVNSHQLLETCREKLIRKGLPEDCIEVKTQPRVYSIAEDILKSAEIGSYDAVLVGRSGASGIRELLMGSVTSNLLSQAHFIPLWIVDGSVTSQKVLVAVDGTPSSLKAVDHVSFIFSGNQDVTIEFLNIVPRIGDVCEVDTDTLETADLEEAMLISNEKCITDFSAVSRGILKSAGFSDDQIVFRSEKHMFSPGKAIIDIVKKENFGTIVVGKSSAAETSHVGRVAGHIVQKISDRAVWIIP